FAWRHTRSSTRLRSEMSVMVPVMRIGLPRASRATTTPRDNTHFHDPSLQRKRYSHMYEGELPSRHAFNVDIAWGKSSGWMCALRHPAFLPDRSCSLYPSISFHCLEKVVLSLVISQSHTPSPDPSTAIFRRSLLTNNSS